MALKIKDKAIVTGAFKRIGVSIAKHLSSKGASVIGNYISSKDDADRVVNEPPKRVPKLLP